jgi:hypothetical protein
MGLLKITAGALLAFIAVAADETFPANATNDDVEKERAAQAIELCRKGAREYRLCLDDATRTELELKPEPLLRWSNPAVGSIHGVVFVWTHEGRPAAVASIYKWFEPHSHMAFEVHSLSEMPLVGFLGEQLVWKSSRAGIEFKPLDGAPAPAETASGRLTQMRNLAKDFTVKKTDRDDATHQRMRLLTQPIFRYRSLAENIADGTMFAFVQGTDPEVLLLIEPHDATGGRSWHYALARMNSTAFGVSYKDHEVWRTEVIPWATVRDNRSPYNVLSLEHLSPPQK